MLALVVASRLVVEQRQDELLARRPEAAGGAVEPAQYDVLDDPLGTADGLVIALLAGIGDLHGLALQALVGDRVASRQGERQRQRDRHQPRARRPAYGPPARGRPSQPPAAEAIGARPAEPAACG